MGDVRRITLVSSGMRALLRSSEVQADLRARAARIAQAAGPGMSYDSHVGTNRARATVWTATHEARRAEATNRALTRALDAGR